MKATTIRFLSPSENTQPKKIKPSKVIFTGYVSGAGKLVFPNKTVAGLGVDFANTAFKIGVQEGKTKATSIYIVPADSEETETFIFQKGAKSYTLLLAGILRNIGIDYAKNKYRFVIQLFNFDNVDGLELQLQTSEGAKPKAPYTGKPRGPKPKTTDGAA